MNRVKPNVVVADWRLKEIAEAHNNLNKSYFETGEYKKYPAFFKLKEAFDWILKRANGQLSVLDIGCGAGWHAIYLEKEGMLENISFSGCDLSGEMCKLANQNFPEGDFFEIDICKEPTQDKYNIVLESAVIEIIHDWRSGLKNMLKSSQEWFISHRLFTSKTESRTEQVVTYNNIPDMRFHISLKDFEDVLDEEGFKLVRSDVWAHTPFIMGTYICRRKKNG